MTPFLLTLFESCPARKGGKGITPFSLILFVSPLAEQGKSDDTVFTHTICKPSGPYSGKGIRLFDSYYFSAVWPVRGKRNDAIFMSAVWPERGKGMNPFSPTLFVSRLAHTGEKG